MLTNKITKSRQYIIFQTLANMAVKNLLFKKFRSTLTILGVIIGIGSIFLLLAFGIGLQRLVQGQIAGSKAINAIDVTRASRAISLDQEGVERIKGIANVKEVSGEYTEAGKLTLNQASADVVAYGVDKTILPLLDLKLSAGKILDTDKNDQLLVGRSLLEAAGIKNPSSVVNKTVKLDILSDEKQFSKNFTITGVTESGSGAEVFISKDVFRQGGVTEYAIIKAVADDRSQISDVRKKIESYGYNTTSPVDTIDQINQVFRFFNIILVGFGSIGMIIAVLGMLNTLTVSLLERTQEIALMMALGGLPSDMRKLFVIEAVLLSSVGGVIGMTLAAIFGQLVNLVLNGFAIQRGVTQHFSVVATPPELVIGMLAFTILVGVAVAYIPAQHASRIKPIDALRHE